MLDVPYTTKNCPSSYATFRRPLDIHGGENSEHNHTLITEMDVYLFIITNENYPVNKDWIFFPPELYHELFTISDSHYTNNNSNCGAWISNTTFQNHSAPADGNIPDDSASSCWPLMTSLHLLIKPCMSIYIWKYILFHYKWLFVGVQLLYHVVLLSVQQSESAICICISPPSWAL